MPKPIPFKREWTKENDAVWMKCIQHPTYLGRRKPRTDCLRCWEIFYEIEGRRLEVASKVLEEAWKKLHPEGTDE